MPHKDRGPEKVGGQPRADQKYHPVFADPGHRRRRRFHVAVVVLAVSLTVWIVGFSLSLYDVAKLPGAAVIDAQAGLQAKVFPPAAAPSLPAPATVGLTTQGICTDGTAPPPPAAAGMPPAVHIYLPYWAEWTYASFSRNCGAGDVLLAERFAVTLPDPALQHLSLDGDQQTQIAQRLKTDLGGVKVLPVLTFTLSLDVAQDEAFLQDAGAEARLADEIATAAAEGGYDGICIAPTNYPDEVLGGLRNFLIRVARAARAGGHQACLISPGEAPFWHDATVVAAFDKVMIQAFQDPWMAAPLAPQDWFETLAHAAVAAVPRDKLVLLLGSFAKDWQADKPDGERIAFAEAMVRAAMHSARPAFDADSLNDALDYTDDSGATHRIWFLDAASFFNQTTVAKRLGITNLGVWSLGYEDPDIWPLLRAPDPLPLSALAPIDLADYVGYEGGGSFQVLAQSIREGHRDLGLDPCTGLISHESYLRLPTPYTIERFGKTQPKTLALTFDDGPDPVFTPKILDVLKRENVPAAFFMVGSNMLRAPGIVQRVVDEGQEVGSHTFFHDQFERLPDLRQRLDLNAVQRLLVALTGRGTVLFRFPYGRGDGPLTDEEARPMVILKAQGYLAVGSEIDAPDWAGLTAPQIVDFIRSALKEDGGTVIVMHDSGGDRSATVAALPTLIDGLRRDGYSFVSLSDLLGVSRDALMPPEAGPRSLFETVSFGFLARFWSGLAWVFWVVIFLGLARTLSVVTMALLRRPVAQNDPAFAPSVAVVIPAYNEEDIVLRTIASVLASDYPRLQVIVVDDGSTDHTFQRVREAYPPGGAVLLIHEPNMGKAKAMDTAYDVIRAEIVVGIDGDTLLSPDAIRKLVSAFQDPRVGAVAGNVKVGNRHRLLARLQALEYITAQNVDRRAAEFYDGIMVVPGAIGAWRARAVRAAQLYSTDTLAEDADLTLAVHRAGYRIAYREDAFSYTEAPETIRAFMKQRLRWTLGMMQAAWKHRRAIREGRAVGLISILDLAVFGVILGLLAPLADLVFLHSLANMVAAAISGGNQPSLAYPALVVASYLVLPLADLGTAVLAFRFERHEDPLLLLMVPFQRFFYRQLLYVTVYRAVLRSISGRLASWGKLKRLGTVHLPGR